MREKLHDIQKIIKMSRDEYFDYWFGSLSDSPRIRDKRAANPDYLLSPEHMKDQGDLLMSIYGGDKEAAAKEIKSILQEISDFDLKLARQQMAIAAVNEKHLIAKAKIKPSTIATIILYCSIPEDCIGDLEELYNKVAQDRGVREATIWLWCQVAKSVFHFAFAAILRAIKLSDLLDWIFKTL